MKEAERGGHADARAHGGRCPHCSAKLRSIDLTVRELSDMAAQEKSRFTHQFSRHPQPLYAQPRAELLCVLQVNKLARVGEQQSKKFDDFKRFLERGGPPDAVPHLSLSSFIRPYLTMSLSLNSLFCLTMCRSSTGPTWGTTRSGRSRASRSATCRCGHRPAPVTVRIALRLPRLRWPRCAGCGGGFWGLGWTLDGRG